jgi:hypothetical protein
MKKLKLLTFIISWLVSGTVTAQLNIDPDTKKVLYQETVTIDSLDKKALYERGVEWMTKNFKTNKFDVNDKVNLKLAHEGTFPVSYTYDFKYKSENTVTYVLNIDFKDGKYRYTITDFKIYKTDLGVKTAQPLEAYYQKMKTDSKKEFSTNFSNEVNKIIEDLKKNMKAAKTSEEEDW